MSINNNNQGAALKLLNILNFLKLEAHPSTIYTDDLAHMNKFAFLRSYNLPRYK